MIISLNIKNSAWFSICDNVYIEDDVKVIDRCHVEKLCIEIVM